MPELPEVETTVRGLSQKLSGLTISRVWTDYKSDFHTGKNNIKDPRFFTSFKKNTTGQKIIGASKRGKNVLIHLANGKTLLIHMKMTGHFLYGTYIKTKNTWVPKTSKRSPSSNISALSDPFNRFIHLVLVLSNGHHLAFSDMRKFAKITIIDTKDLEKNPELSHLGPEPLEKDFTFLRFKDRLMTRPKGIIKQVLMDQAVIAGIGNIYSDEVLWYAKVHPKSIVRQIDLASLKKIYNEIKKILPLSISLGGDSMSDFRNLDGKKGGFQNHHHAYKQNNKACTMKNCSGVIAKMKVGGRSAHFCPIHQRLF